MTESYLNESLCRYIGQTVTIFTTSGGLSGSGFTGTLASVSGCTVKLITDIGAAPACACGSACTGFGEGSLFFGAYGGINNGGNGGGCGCGGGNNVATPRYGRNWLGSVTEIPIDRIASFTHNAI